jgi:hypothetical protein
LVIHFDEYDELMTVRSRVSGNTPMIGVVLGFAAQRQIGDIQRVTDKIAETVQALIPGAMVTVTSIANRRRVRRRRLPRRG